MQERKPVTREFAIRYRAAKTKPEKSKALDDFIAIAGYNRKYAIGVLGVERKTKLLRLNGTLLRARITHKTGRKRAYKKYYGPDVAACVVRLWEFFNGMCGSRLAPLIRANIAALTRERRFGITADVREKLVKISRSTVDRTLRGERNERRLKGRSAATPGSLLRNQTPVKVFWPWNGQKPGFCETDTVSHDGGNASGEYADRRSGSYHKNDNCYVEQKNGDVARKTSGCARYTNEEALAAVYRSLNPLLNYFYPCTKLVDKTRDEKGKARKVYGRPAAPYERLLAREDVGEEAKELPRAYRKRLNIVRLQDEVGRAVDRLLQTAQRY